MQQNFVLTDTAGIPRAAFQLVHTSIAMLNTKLGNSVKWVTETNSTWKCCTAAAEAGTSPCESCQYKPGQPLVDC